MTGGSAAYSVEDIIPGEQVRYWKPGHAEHGAIGICYRTSAESGEVDTTQGYRIGGTVLLGWHPAVSEREYQRRRAKAPAGRFWPD